MPSVVVKQIRTWQLPQGVPSHPPELSIGTILRLTIEFDGHGYYLVANEVDGDYSLSEWHASLKVAEQKAAQLFGPKSRDWETVGMQ